MSQTSFVTAVSPKEHQARIAIRDAANRTGVDFDYLLAQAKMESSLDPEAKAPSSSASGLYQFINSTWLSVLDRHGASLGFENEAAAIETRGGKSRITDPSQRGAIMALRFDAGASAMMAAALAQDNRDALMPVLGREPDSSELYLAHFLGSAGATRFLTALERNPEQSAAALMPDAAASNRGIFYSSNGESRSLREVFGVIERKLANAMESPMDYRMGSFRAGKFAAAGRTGSYGQAGSSPRLIPTLGPMLQDSNGQNTTRSMSETLNAAFGIANTRQSGSAVDHARRAYQRLGAFGL